MKKALSKPPAKKPKLEITKEEEDVKPTQASQAPKIGTYSRIFLEISVILAGKWLL